MTEEEKKEVIGNGTGGGGGRKLSAVAGPADEKADTKSIKSIRSTLTVNSVRSRHSSIDLHKAENGEVFREGSIHDDDAMSLAPAAPEDNDDASSEIARVEEAAAEEERQKNTTMGRIVRTMQMLRNWATGRQNAGEPKEEERPDSFLEKFAMGNNQGNAQANSGKWCDPRNILTWTVDPSSNFYYRWLGVISFAVLYNLIIIIARAVFWKLQDDYLALWLVLDYTCDVIYLGDMFVQFRTVFIQQGLPVKDTRILRRRHMRTLTFYANVCSILPTDLFYLLIESGLGAAYVRLNRALRFTRLLEFVDKTDTRINNPNAFRAFTLVIYILIIIHWNACVYFQLSAWVGFGTDEWVYFDISDEFPGNQSLSRMYIYSFWWSMLTLTTIGETPKPEEDVEYAFMVVDFLIGVVIFATIVGNIGSMITNMNANRAGFQHKMDAVKQYMKLRRVGKNLEKRVIKWFDYMWQNSSGLGDHSFFSLLPDKLKAEIAIHVHIAALRRVNLFKDCDPGLLVQLVLRLKLSVFSPGDYVCRKGDIGKELYIVKRGLLSVVSDDGKTIFATLSEGSVFGEISLLNIAGNKTGNRRSANVRSNGYSDLFILSKSDLWTALNDYPEAKTRLIEKGRELLLKDNLLDLEVANKVENPNSTPEDKLREIEEGLENMNTWLNRFTAEFTSTDIDLIHRVRKLENTCRNRSDIQSLSPYSLSSFHSNYPSQISMSMKSFSMKKMD